MREPVASEIERGAPRARPRAAGWVPRALAVSLVLGVVFGAARLSSRAESGGDVRLGPGAAVVRGDRRIASIERVGRSQRRGGLPRYIAPARGPVIDSARVGVLAARLVPGTDTGSAPIVALVPRDSVAGLALVARLVVAPGESGLLVYGAKEGRP